MALAAQLEGAASAAAQGEYLTALVLVLFGLLAAAAVVIGYLQRRLDRLQEARLVDAAARLAAEKEAQKELAAVAAASIKADGAVAEGLSDVADGLSRLEQELRGAAPPRPRKAGGR